MRTLTKKASDLVPVYCPSVNHLNRLDRKVSRIYDKVAKMQRDGETNTHYYRYLCTTIEHTEQTIASGEKRRMAYGLDIYEEKFSDDNSR